MATKPTLSLIPSAYKASKVYSVLPNNGDGDFTFSRTGTATRVNKDGIIETVGSNVPRLDYSDNSCPSLLLEPQRTNTFLTSEPTSNEGGAGNITYESHFWENGLQNAVRFASGVTGYRYGGTAPASTEMVFSCYIKMNDGGEPFMSNSTTDPNVDLRLVVGNTPVSSYKKKYVGNNIWRVWGIGITASSVSSNNGIVKNSGQSNRGFICTGFQLEAGSYPTSYIKTTGSTVTRLADNCYGAGDSNLFDTTLGTFYLDITPYLSENSPYYISMSDGTNNNRFDLFFYDSQQIRFYVIGNGGSSVSAYYAIPFNQRMKIAITFRQNEFYFYVNGKLIAKDASGNIPIGLDRINFSAHYNGAFFEGKVHDARFYNEVLSTTELATLTSN